LLKRRRAGVAQPAFEHGRLLRWRHPEKAR
jgi:hypothetical protein